MKEMEEIENKAKEAQIVIQGTITYVDGEYDVWLHVDKEHTSTYYRKRMTGDLGVVARKALDDIKGAF